MVLCVSIEEIGKRFYLAFAVAILNNGTKSCNSEATTPLRIIVEMCITWALKYVLQIVFNSALGC